MNKKQVNKVNLSKPEIVAYTLYTCNNYTTTKGKDLSWTTIEPHNTIKKSFR